MPGTALKATNAQILERIEFTAQLMGSGAPDYAVRRKIKDEYGIGRRMCDRYMSRARDLMIAWTGRAKESHFVDSYNHYRTLIQMSSDPMVRLHAQERIDSLFGLDEKYKRKAEQEGEESQSPGVQVNVAVSVVREMLNDPAYIEYVESRKLAEDIDASNVRWQRGARVADGPPPQSNQSATSPSQP